MAFDAERMSNRDLTFVVEARDGGTPLLASMAELKLRVQDINDNAPVFAEPGPTLEIPENTELCKYICMYICIFSSFL